MSDERRQSEEQFSRLFQTLRADEDPNPAFADALLLQLEEEAAQRRRGGRTWILLAAALLVAGLATGAVFGSGLVPAPWLIADVDGTPGPTTSGEPLPSEAPSGTPDSSPGPNATLPPAAPTNFVARVVVAGLALREAPGLDAEVLGTFPEGQIGLVIKGPVVADGYDWYQFSGLGIPHLPQSGCAAPETEQTLACPFWFGWVPAASQPDAEAWIEPATLDCPDSPMNMQELARRGEIERLACNLDGSITMRGWWPELPEGLGGVCGGANHPSAWLYCQNVNYDQLVADETQEFGGLRLSINFDPTIANPVPQRGQWVEIVAHFDDPAARGCDETAAIADDEDDPDRIVLICRAQLVVESMRAVSGPF